MVEECAICGLAIDESERHCLSEETQMLMHARCFEGVATFIEESMLITTLHRRDGLPAKIAKSAAEAYGRARRRMEEGRHFHADRVSLTVGDYHMSWSESPARIKEWLGW